MRYGAVMDAATSREEMLKDLRTLRPGNTVFVFEEFGDRTISEDIRILSDLGGLQGSLR